MDFSVDLGLFLISIFILSGCNYPQQAPPEDTLTEPLSAENISAPIQSIFGIDDTNAQFDQTSDLITLLYPNWMRRTGAIWSSVEPIEGQRNWEQLRDIEDWLVSVSEVGVTPIFIVRGTPPWAQKIDQIACGPILDEKIPAFGNFLYDLVVRYSQPPYNVKYWEIWNEPDASPDKVGPNSPFGCWGDPGKEYYGGEYYGDLLKSIYPRIKQADIDAKVLIGGLLLDCDPDNPPILSSDPTNVKDCSSSKFFEGILKSGAADSFDGLSFHGYDFYLAARGKFGNPNWNSAWNTSGTVLIPKTRFLMNLLEKYQVNGKFLINTEVGLLCSIPTDATSCQSADFENTKADYVVKSFTEAMANGLVGNIWFTLTGWRNSGLVTPQGQPLPAYNAYRFASQMLGEAVYVRPLQLGDGIKGYWFERDKTAIWVVWSNENQQTISLPPEVSKISSVSGASIPITNELEIISSPVYIEWYGD